MRCEIISLYCSNPGSRLVTCTRMRRQRCKCCVIIEREPCTWGEMDNIWGEMDKWTCGSEYPSLQHSYFPGVVLFPWVARVFDRDLAGRKEARIDPAQTESASFNNVGTGRDVKGKSVPYYQVLIDARDCPYIRAQSETVTFLGHQESSRSLYAIPGYVLLLVSIFPIQKSPLLLLSRVADDKIRYRSAWKNSAWPFLPGLQKLYHDQYQQLEFICPNPNDERRKWKRKLRATGTLALTNWSLKHLVETSFFVAEVLEFSSRVKVLLCRKFAEIWQLFRFLNVQLDAEHCHSLSRRNRCQPESRQKFAQSCQCFDSGTEASIFGRSVYFSCLRGEIFIMESLLLWGSH